VNETRTGSSGLSQNESTQKELKEGITWYSGIMGLLKIDKREEERGGTPGRMPKKTEP
jgi:hypothetical protein